MKISAKIGVLGGAVLLVGGSLLLSWSPEETGRAGPEAGDLRSGFPAVPSSSPAANVVTEGLATDLAEIPAQPLSVIKRLGPSVPWTSRNPAAFEAREVVVDPALLNIKAAPLVRGDRLAFDLPDGTRLEGVVTTNHFWGQGDRTFSASAKISGDPGGFIVLSSVDGMLRVLIVRSGVDQVYQLRYDNERGGHVLLHVDHAGSEVYACANGPEHDVHDMAPLDTASSDQPFEPTPSSSESDSLELTRLGVMIAYTPAALAFESSLSSMQLNISQAIAVTNLIHTNSNTQVQFDLVHTMAVDYNEAVFGAGTALDHLSGTTDGYMDEVHQLRDFHGADFVSLFLDTQVAGGLAYRATTYNRPDIAFSIVRVQQSDTTSYTTAHEISHNMGNGHSKTQAVQSYPGDGIATYSAGWQWADVESPAEVGYCSVMTYENFDNFGGEEFMRVPHFSNPDIQYAGQTTGDAVDADAARTIREGRLIYASFREPYAFSVIDSFPYSHGFESEDPVWVQDLGDTHDWILNQSGPTVSSFTGPSVGASEGSFYAFVEATGFYNQQAQILAQLDLRNEAAMQLVFDYHMLDEEPDEPGDDMGDLAVELSIDGAQTWINLRQFSGNQGDYWRRALVDLTPYCGEVTYLRFRATVGPWYPSDIAIDRIKLGDALITEAPGSYEDWLAASYPNLSDPSRTGNEDGDTFDNFSEYVFDLSPQNVDRSADALQLFVDADAQAVRLEFPLRRPELRYRILAQEGLNDWNSASPVWDSQAELDLVPAGATQAVELSAPEAHRFFRLSVTQD